MNTKLTGAVCFALLTFLATPATSQAQGARVPVGLWRDQSSPLSLQIGAGGLAIYSPVPGSVTSGNWTWNSTSPKGGILTIHYTTYAGINVFHNKMYYSLTWVNENTVVISDPYFKATLKRQ